MEGSKEMEHAVVGLFETLHEFRTPLKLAFRYYALIGASTVVGLALSMYTAPPKTTSVVMVSGKLLGSGDIGGRGGIDGRGGRGGSEGAGNEPMENPAAGGLGLLCSAAAGLDDSVTCSVPSAARGAG